MICMNDVEQTEVDWLWHPYIPFGKLTIVQGNLGEGKTSFAKFYVISFSSYAEVFQVAKGFILLVSDITKLRYILMTEKDCADSNIMKRSDIGLEHLSVILKPIWHFYRKYD